MAARKTIMVEEPVWKKIDSFKHMFRKNSIGEAIYYAVSTLESSKYFAGVYADSEHRYLVEAVGRSEDETRVNFIDNTECPCYPSDLDEIYLESENTGRKYEYDFFIVECTKEMYYEYLLFSDWSKRQEWMPCYCHLKGNVGKRTAYTLTFQDAAESNHMYALVDIQNMQVVNIGYSEIQMLTTSLRYVLDEYPDDYDIWEYMKLLKIMKCTPEFASEFIRFTQPLGPLESRVIHRIVSESGEDIIDTTPNDKYYAVVSFDSEEEMNPTIREIGRTATEAKSNFINRLPRYLDGLYDDWGPNKWEANENQTEWKNDTNGYYDDLIIMECSKQLYAGVLSSEWYEKCKSGYSDDDEIDEDLKPITCEIEEIDGVRRVI